jgi:endonuclease/exonuclease/phosphatase (EEP) superfamily protein YafD
MLRRAFILLTAVGSVVWLLLLAFARWGDVARRWPIELLDTFALYAFLPYVGLGLLALVLRSRLLLGVVLAAALLFWQQFGDLFLPDPAHAASGGPGVRVLTYNVLARNTDAGPLAELVRTERPDVIALQELTPRYADDLVRRLGREYPFVVLAEVAPGGEGSGVFSRLPIVDEKSFKLSNEGNTYQRVRLSLGDREVWLFNVHPMAPRIRTVNPEGPIPPLVRSFGSPTRDRELERLVSETARLQGPYILAGDFNTAAGSRAYRQFPPDWQDAFRKRGWGFGHTFPTHYSLWRQRITVSVPLVRIDYVLSSPHFATGRAWVPWIEGSDHLPVMAELQLSAAP